MEHVYSDEQLTLAARLYYVDRLPQSDVARFVKVSQATVSRLLSAARARGIVKVSVAEYDPRAPELESELVRRFGLKAAIVIGITPGCHGDDVRRGLAHFSGEAVQRLIPARSVVAIAGGRTIRELVLKFPGDPERRITVVQAMGSVDATAGPVDAYELGRELARKLGGAFFTINTPAFVPNRKTRDSFLALPQIQKVWNLLQETTVALVGIGSLRNSVFVSREALNRSELDELAGYGAVGEICGRFFDRHGNECESPWRDRVIGVEISRLRAVPEVIGVVSGTDRADAIIAAIRGGIVKTLVIDAQGAETLIRSDASVIGVQRLSNRKKMNLSGAICHVTPQTVDQTQPKTLSL
jgi:deoxyribonucleoside regulator